MSPRTDAVEGKDFIYTDHPKQPGLKCKAWLDEDGEIISYRSLGDDGRRPGRLITAPKALLDNRLKPGGASLVEQRWQKNEDAINNAIDEWAHDLLKDNYFQKETVEEAEAVVDQIVAGERGVMINGRLGSLSEADSTKLIVRLMLDRYADKKDKPPLRDMVMTVKEVLKISKRTPDTDKQMPTVAVQVNISDGLFSKGFGS